MCFEQTLDTEILGAIFERYVGKIERGILSTTRLHDSETEEFLDKKLEKFIVFDPATIPTPLKNLYRTPHTLGADRLAAAVGAWEYFRSRGRGRDILVFDIGTAITVDFVSAKGEYLGGNISPGLTMRLRALNEMTDRLPLCSADDFEEQMLRGQDTQSAIAQGVVRGICYEIEGYIKAHPRAEIFFTGGDALYFEKRIKNTIFADQQAVTRGLRSILDFENIK